jgi:hypothetical protein
VEETFLTQLFNVHRVNDDKQREIHSAKPLAPEPSAFEAEIVTERL